MSSERIYRFEWDDAKKHSNLHKHGIAFEMAVTVFSDPRILTFFDETHSKLEERWVAVGMAGNGSILVVIHTWTEDDAGNVSIRIVSARKATGAETRAYQESI